ncbi:DUF1330 domain-containing protein [Niabella drilacis]|uniref:DUF1330 domain-containing protein n=1 Tax=Niabella drilacis (strain DSM 25811 / CCM 8410 / CCUG 62505 / LMG 26954 / E90) TaxID=1285928 RepID=A0A1G6PID4_NIADE|nr:DUF1330 domain-containing protein [Niabella drilacis]SDC79177.1 hypothetical protein SAMN04487894_10428 [Niabella drilacis]
MIFVTQLIYIKEGSEAVFHEFEQRALPLIKKYNGRLLLRLRPQKADFIEVNTEPPYELHLVSFETEADFRRFLEDEERKQFLHLKEQSIRSAVLIQGKQL